MWARSEGHHSRHRKPTNALATGDRRSGARPSRRVKRRVIVFNFSGHGLLDLAGYEKYLASGLTDFELSQEEMDRSIAVMDDFPKPQDLKSTQ
jgi:tryptophan synthase beta chain